MLKSDRLFRDIKTQMEDSDELFDYISDLPSDNVLEICNFVLIGGGTEGGGGEVDSGGGGVVGGQGVACCEDNPSNQYNDFVEILDYQLSNNNNNIESNTLNGGHEKVKIITTV